MTPRVALAVLVALAALLLGPLAIPSGADAAVAGHFVGHTWAGDGTSYLGSYRLDDGTIAYCIDQPSGPPTGVNYSAVDDVTPVAEPDLQAKLAYLMRTWGSTTDATTAAAVALNVWRLTGLGGHSDSYFAARANASAAAVLALADAQAAEAAARGSRGATAAVAVTVDAGAATGSVVAELTIDSLAGQNLAPPGSHEATVTVEGAVFESSGSATARVLNGVAAKIVPGLHSVVTVSATARFDALPYGSGLGVIRPDDASRQRLIVATPVRLAATSETVVSPPVVRTLPFQPLVETKTSAAVAEPGVPLADTLAVSVRKTVDNPSGDWGKRGDPAAPENVALLVRSTLWGPFSDPVTEQPTVPDGAATVCEVTTTVVGPGSYQTDSCVLQTSGYYVWTERINPADSPHPEGRDSAGAWQSGFGVATEVTFVTAPVAPVAPPAAAPAAPPAAKPAAPPAAEPAPRELAVTGVSGHLLAGLGWFGAASVLLGSALLGSAQAFARARRSSGRHRL